MSNFPNIVDHITPLIHKRGNFKPFLPPAEGGGPAQSLLADLDFSSAQASWTSGRTGFSSAFSDEEWDMQTYSGGYANQAGTDPLTNNGGGLTGQVCPVIHDGTGYGNRNCWERDASTGFSQYLEAGNAATLETDTDDIAGRVVFTMVANSGSFQDILTKLDAGVGGWRLRMTSAGGLNPQIQLHDGTNYVQAQNTGAAFNDGALHYLSFFWDSSASLLYIKSDLNGEHSVSTSTLTSGIANAAFPLKICRASTIGPIQIHHVSGAVGANAASHYAETFWQHAGDPTGLLTTINRDCLISVPVGPGQVGHFSGATSNAQLPIEYTGSFWSAGNFGLRCNGAHTNLIQYSEELASGTGNWSSTACSTTDNDDDSPDGFRTADLLTQTGADGHKFYIQGSGLTAATDYTFSVWLKADSAHTATLVISDGSGSTTPIVESDVSVTTSWQRFSVTGTTGGAQTTCRVIIYPGEKGVASSATVHAWGAQLMEGDWSADNGPYLRTSGAAASSVASRYQSTSVPMEARQGEAISVFSQSYSANHYVWYCVESGQINSFVNFGIISQKARLYWANNVGGVEENYSSVANIVYGTEQTVRHLWDYAGITDGSDYESILYLEGTKLQGGTMPFEGTIDDKPCDNFVIGGNTAAGFPLDGMIQSVKIYDIPGVIT